MNFLHNLLNKGLSITFSTGKPFNPYNQKRTDAVRDIIEADKKRKVKDEDISKTV